MSLPQTCPSAVYDREVAEPLEDSLVSGFTRLAAETPRRRIDIELRVLDTLLAVLFGVLAAPVAAAIAVAILVSDGRPVLYRGERVGRHGHLFTILKFRTLRQDWAVRVQS